MKAKFISWIFIYIIVNAEFQKWREIALKQCYNSQCKWYSPNVLPYLTKDHTHTLFVLKNIWISESLKYFKRSLFTCIVSVVSLIASWTKYIQNVNPLGLKHNCYWSHCWYTMWTISHIHDSFCDELEMAKDP